MRTLAADFNLCCQTADKRAERGIASAYDEVNRSLLDLSDAYALCATRAGFIAKGLNGAISVVQGTEIAMEPAFHKALLQEGVECLLAGDVDTGKSVLRDYINATIGFVELSQVFDKSSKSLMRMFGPKENPQASHLFAVIQYLQ